MGQCTCEFEQYHNQGYYGKVNLNQFLEFVFCILGKMKVTDESFSLLLLTWQLRL